MNRLSDIHTIGVFRALQLGDLLCSVPAFRALRAAFPKAHIALIGLPWAAEFVRRFDSYFDEFIHFPGAQGLPEQGFDDEKLKEFGEVMRMRSFDLLLQMQGNGTIVNELLLGWGAKIFAGFHNAESRIKTEFFVEYPNGGPEVRRHLCLMEHLRIPSAGEHLEFCLTDADRCEFLALGLPQGNYVVVHPGSRGAWRRWSAEHFARCADRCAQKGYQIVMSGTAAEADITATVRSYMRSPAIDLAGKTSVGAVGCLIKNASLLIANCTGVSHIAAATQTPSVIISMDGEPGRWSPLDRRLHHVFDWTKEQDVEQVLEVVDGEWWGFVEL